MTIKTEKKAYLDTLEEIYPTPEKPDYKPRARDKKVLPFIEATRKKTNFWAVEPTEDYGYACRKGTEYAARYLQYLKDNKGRIIVPMLGDIVYDMKAYDRGSSMNGYSVGFIHHIDEVLQEIVDHFDLWAYFEKSDKRSREFALNHHAEAEVDKTSKSK